MVDLAVARGIRLGQACSPVASGRLLVQDEIPAGRKEFEIFAAKERERGGVFALRMRRQKKSDKPVG